MRSLLFFAISWISFTISYALIAPRSSQNLEADLFGNAPIDPTLISVEPSFEHMGPLDQPPDPYSSFFFDNHDPYLTAELDTNNFISEDNNLNQLTDSTFWLADDNFCDLDNTDENDLFRKVRRETSCRDPLVSQVKPRKQPKKNAQRSDLRFFYKDPMVLDISKAMCPPEIFGTSILPTCLTAFDGRSISVPGQDWFNLENVFPPEPLGCPGGFVFLWCCKDIVTRELPADPSIQLPIDNLLSPARALFDGLVCYQWKFAVLLEPPTKL